jgi:predicted peptidase
MKAFDLQLMETAGLHFLLSLPEGKTGKIPVLCFLHGYDEGAPADIRVGVTRHGPLRQGSAAIATREFIVVAPQLPERGDMWRFHADTVAEIVREVYSRHYGDPGSTYLTGFSFGGNGVFDLAILQPTLWSALWPVDPTRVPESDPGLPVWLSSGQVSRPRAEGFIERLRLQPAGGNDAGDRIYTDDGLDHVGTASSAYGNERIYRWLLSKRTSSRSGTIAERFVR